jgi:integrase
MACNEYLDFCERRFAHITYCEKRKLCRDILKKWGDININYVTPIMVIKHLEDRAHTISNSAWNKDRKNLLAMFNWLRKIHNITNNPVANVDRLPEDRKLEYIPPAEDIDRVMMACGEHDRVMLQCYYFTFARKSEIFNWTWEDINFEKQWYRLWTKKRLHSDNQVDYFPLPEGSELYTALKWQWEHRNKNSKYIFTNPETGEKFVSRRRFIKGLCKRAGVRSFSFKAFRKFGPSVLNDVHKVSMKKLQTLLRHQNQKTTEIYLKNVDNDLSASVRLLEKRDTQRDTQNEKGLTIID